MWNDLNAHQRCRTVAAAAQAICRRSQDLIDACRSEQRVDPVETISGELIPLCAALRFLGRRGPNVLRDRRVGLGGQPAWLFGVRSIVKRVPVGRVLILGTWNYPLLLPGVQIAQALAAGNRVSFKPAVGTEQVAAILCDCLHSPGIPAEQLELMDSSTEAAKRAIQAGADLILLTGAAETGRKVLESAAGKLSASIMELSGCDAVITLPGFDLHRLLRATLFGIRFNSGATCIGPRRLLVQSSDHASILQGLRTALVNEPPFRVHPAARESVAASIAAAIDAGANDVLDHFDEHDLRNRGEMRPVILDGVSAEDAIAPADLFAPVLSIIGVEDDDHAVRLVNDCPYRLAASVFGPERRARAIAQRLEVGTVTINDMVAPTADPRLPFGGRGHSGFGLTRGPEGLLAMTTAKVVSTRSSKIAPHLRDRSPGDEEILHGLLHLSHRRGWRNRLAGLRRIIAGVKKGT